VDDSWVKVGAAVAVGVGEKTVVVEVVFAAVVESLAFEN